MRGGDYYFGLGNTWRAVSGGGTVSVCNRKLGDMWLRYFMRAEGSQPPVSGLGSTVEFEGFDERLGIER